MRDVADLVEILDGQEELVHNPLAFGGGELDVFDEIREEIPARHSATRSAFTSVARTGMRAAGERCG